jgi:hypothetical protein
MTPAPDVRVIRVLNSEHDGRVADVADVDLAAADERDAGGGARGAGKT